MERPTTIVLTGGGSGGHITPILSVAHELKKKQPAWSLSYIGQKGDPMGSLADSSDLDGLYAVRAGKLRRYHGQSALARLTDIRTQLLNIRDGFYLIIGTIEAWWLLKRLKPAAILVKGGYVGVPVAWAARLLHIPYITHDSDSVAGLANRLVSKKAAWHATGMPADFYNYPTNKTSHTGVPVSQKFHPLSPNDQKAIRAEMGIDDSRFVVLVIGGSLGADRLNSLMINASPELVAEQPKAFIIHLSGGKLYQKVVDGYAKQLGSKIEKHVKVINYSNQLQDLSGIADLVITRAGATTLAELAVQGKTVIVVPNPDLTGGHQLKNSTILKDKAAAVEFLQDKPANQLAELVTSLSNDPKARQQLANNLRATARPEAASELADILIKIAESY